MIFRSAHRRVVLLLLSLYLAALAVAVGGPLIRPAIDDMVFAGHEQHQHHVQTVTSSHHSCWTSNYLLGCMLCSGVPVSYSHPHDATPVPHELSYAWLPDHQPARSGLTRSRPPARGPPLLA